jgi:hypothetical protein
MSAIDVSEQDPQQLAQRGYDGAARATAISRQAVALFLADYGFANLTV